MKGSIATSTLIVTLSYVGAALLDYAFGAGMAWLLAPADYGALSVSLSFFLILSLFVASGFPTSLAKFLSESERPRPELVRFAVAGNFVLSLMAAAVFLALTFYGPLSPGPGYGRLVVLVAATVVVLSVGTTLQFALQGQMRFATFGILHASKSFNKLAVGAGMVLLGFGVVGAASGLLVGALVLVVACAFLVLKHAPPTQDAGAGALTREEKQRFMQYTGAVFVGSLALTLLMNLDLLGVKYLTPAATSNLSAAYYQAASILAKAPLWIVIAGMGVFFPLMSREAMRDAQAAQRLLRRVLRWTILGLAPITAVLVAFPDLALALLFPAVYVTAAPALAASALAMGALAVCFVLTRALQAAGHASAPGAFLAVSAGLQFALLIALVPRMGLEGAAVATLVACAAGALLAAIAAAKAFDLRASGADVVKFTVSLALLVAIVGAMAPTTRIGTLAALATGTLAYASAIYLLELVSPDEKRGLRALLGRVARGLREPSEEPDPVREP